MNILEIIGLCTIVIFGTFLLYIIYHIGRGMILAVDYMQWCLIGVDQENISKFGKWKFVKAWWANSVDFIGYDCQFTYTRGQYKWSGYGTGRSIEE